MNQVIQQNMTPGPVKTFQQNQSVINPADGKSYNVQQQTPGKGITLIDPTTNQTVMVGENEVQNLQPAIKTTADIVLDEVLGVKKDTIDQEASDFSIEAMANSIVEELTGEKMPEVKIASKKELQKMRVSNMKRNWHAIRKQLKTQSQMNPQEIQSQPTYNEPRQSRAMREMGLDKEAKYNPYKGDLIKEVGRDKKTGLPMRGGDDIEVGLTEFPYGVDKAKNPEGYGATTMEEMDRKFEEDRDHFKNEQLLPDYTKKREESDTYLNRRDKDKKIKDLRKDHNEPRYSTSENGEDNTKEASVDEALDEVIGAKKKVAADELAPTGPEKLPVQFKDISKAPGKDIGYIEPDVLEQASPDIKTAIEMFKETQSKIADIKAKIDEKTKPLQQAIQDATKDLNTDLASQAALLKTSLDLIYSELDKTNDKVAVLSEEIYANVSREKAIAPPASLAQILQKAHTINPQLEEEINKVKALIESDNTRMVMEQFLYRYPIKEPQKKKIKAALEDNNLNQFLTEVNNIVDSLQTLNESI